MKLLEMGRVGGPEALGIREADVGRRRHGRFSGGGAPEERLVAAARSAALGNAQPRSDNP